MLYRVPMQRREFWFEGPEGLDLPAIHRHFMVRRPEWCAFSGRLLLAILHGEEIPEPLRAGAKLLGLRGVYPDDELFVVHLWLSDYGLTPAAPGVVDDHEDHLTALQKLRSRRSHLARCGLGPCFEGSAS